jgi:hypothetical protein
MAKVKPVKVSDADDRPVRHIRIGNERRLS